MSCAAPGSAEPPVFFVVVARLVAALPWRILPIFGAVLAFLAGSVLRIRRGHVEAGMRAAGISRPAARARAMYRALGTSVMELLWISGRRAAAADHARIDEPSLRRWRAAVGGGRGVVVASSHTGNWDLAACAVAREVEILVVTKRLRMRGLDAFWQRTRAAQGVRLTGADGAMKRAREVLARGGAVAMMIDQAPLDARRAIEAPFLGRPALIDRAPAALAAAARAPLVVAASRRERGGGQVLAVLDVLEPPERPSRAWIERATALANERLDAFIRAHPSEWLWLHRRWKRPGLPAPVPAQAPAPEAEPQPARSAGEASA